VNQAEKALPYFLRDITEMMKIGYNINQTLIQLPKQRTYNRAFDRLLRRVAEHLEMNMPLRTITETMRVRSWLCNYVFFILSEIVDTGGGTPETLESLTSFVNGIYIEKSKAKSTTRSYAFLGYATPAFLSAVMVFMTNMLMPSMGSVGGGLSMISVMPSSTTLLQISELGMMVAVLTALVVGLLIAKIVDMSIYATYHVSIALMICLVAFIVIK
jgi:flagellar protein FlaJ